MAIVVTATQLFAQTIVAPRPEAGAKPAADEPVMLSPFQLSSDRVHGYQTRDTLAGTRLNALLEDLGSSITVVTLQQLADTASLDLNDVFRYEASTEGTASYTQFTALRNGGVNDFVQQDPATANRVRGLGVIGSSGSGINLAFGNQSINNALPVDPYNLAAIEILRGPNSNLFGLGASAGTVNLVPAFADLTHTSASAMLRVDDWGGHRESLNFNQPLLPGRLALRLATVHEEKGFTRQPASERINRLYLTLTAQPFKATTVHASFERYDNRYRRPNALTPLDTTADWRAAGEPTWDPTTQVVTLANGQQVGPFSVAQDNTLPSGLMTGSALNGRLLTFIDDHQVQLFTPARTGSLITSGTPSPLTQNSNVRFLETGTFLMRNKAALYPLFIAPAVHDKSLYDWEHVNYVAPNWGHDDATTYSAELEHTFLRSESHLLAGRVGWFRQDFTRDNHNFISGTDNDVYIDVNEKLLDGTPNPFFRRLYVEAIDAVQLLTPERSDTQSADLAYQFTPSPDLPRWLSWINTQRLALHGEVNRHESVNYRYSPYVSDDHAWVNLADRVSGSPIAQRFYFGDAGGGTINQAPAAIDTVAGNYPLRWFDNRSPGAWTDESAAVDLLPIRNTTAKRDELRTVNAVVQSFFFDDRLVTTYGWRRDRRRERTSTAAAVDATTGLVSYANLADFGPWTDAQDATVRESQRGDTMTWGGVLKATPWLSFHYNRAESFFPQVVRQRIDLDQGNMPNPYGQGQDYGLSFRAFADRLQVRLNRFDVTEYRSRGSEAGTIGNRTFRLEGRAESNGRRDPQSLYPFAENVVRLRLAAQGIDPPTPAQLRPAVANYMGVTESWLNTFLDSGLAQPQTVGTTDVTSRGYELEAIYNPTPNWRIKLSASQTQAIDLAVSPELFDYWQTRLPTWTTLRADLVPGSGDGQGARWWTTVASNGTTPEATYQSNLLAPYLLATANVGKPRSQVREYRWAAITNYDFTTGPLANFNFGGAIRWEDKAAIGFLGQTPAGGGPIVELDPDRPVWDPARYYVDLFAGYRFRLFSDKVRGKVQLNVKDVFEGGRLQPVGVNPDGSVYAYRIVDPRQFILSASFEL